MIFKNDSMEFIDLNHDYNIVKTGALVCYYRGFIYFKGKKAGKESVEVLLGKYLESNEIDLNYFYGAYHLIIENKSTKQVIFFGDNAGNCCFYYNKDLRAFSDTFIEICGATRDITPDYSAITEFIHFNCIYSESTICNEVLRTSPWNYYTIDASEVRISPKYVSFFDKQTDYKNLNHFLKDLLIAASGLKIVCIITGGTDSRTVLANLESLKANFNLVISGSDELVDVQIAKKISKKINRIIHISDETIDELDNKSLLKLYKRCDGVYGFFSRYRLHKKNIMLEELCVQLELGGVSGELYKNSFLNQDFPFYNIGTINKKRFYKMKINPSNFNNKYFTKNIIELKSKMEENIIKRIFDNQKGTKAQAYFRAGIKLLQYRMVTLSNSSNISVPSISPFSEIDMMKLVYDENPWKLELNKWQRHQVSKYCSEIADIKTDRNLTLKYETRHVLKELISSYLFLVKVGVKRLFQKKEKPILKQNKSIFIEGRHLSEFKIAMQKCKELGILNQECDIEEIPDELSDRLATIGFVFGINEIFEKTI